MVVAQTLVLGDDPIPDTEGAVQLDFYSRESRLGAGEVQLKEGRITFNPKAVSFYRKLETDRIPQPVHAPGTPPFDRYLMVLPFTLHPAPGERKYQRVLFNVELANQNIIASSLIPRDVYTEEDVKRTYTLEGTFEYQGVGGELGLSKEVSFTRLRPVITAFGEGESEFYWRFASQPGEGINDGSKRVAAILDVPRGTRLIQAVITYRIDVQRRWLGDWKDFDAATEPYSIQFNLGGK